MSTLSIILSNAKHCSGKCAFCHACNKTVFAQGYKDLKAIDDVLHNEIKFDFNKLEETLVQHKWFSRTDSINVWGADPLTSFQSFQELIDFLRYIEKKYNKKFALWTSTNGLPLTRDDVAEYVIKNNIKLQLSHDGVCNYFRTGNVEPLNNSNVIDLMKSHITCISCVHTFYNHRPILNYHWFENKLGDKCPSLRLWTAHDGEYDTKAKNVRGLINGKEYAALKNVPFGDYMIRNDYEMAEKYNLPFLAHVADDFFDEYERMYLYPDMYKKAQHALMGRLHLSSNLHQPLCSLYHQGKSNISDCIDTEGYFTECHLIDHNDHVPNPNMNKPSECKLCKFNWPNFECSLCGSMSIRTTSCQFNYRLLQMYGRLNKLMENKK